MLSNEQIFAAQYNAKEVEDEIERRDDGASARHHHESGADRNSAEEVKENGFEVHRRSVEISE